MNRLLQVLAAILLPPLGVFTARGMGRTFWIACGLTLLAYVPGLLFALYTVFTPGHRTAAA